MDYKLIETLQIGCIELDFNDLILLSSVNKLLFEYVCKRVSNHNIAKQTKYILICLDK